MEHINRYFIKINKNDSYFLINKKVNESNLDFWENFSSWENETFEILDRFLDKNKIFIDIGAWIGPSSIYASRKSKHIFALENDTKSIEILEQNCKDNCKNYTIDHKSLDISIKYFINENSIDISNVSLIKVDISGKEENILNDLYEIYSLYKIPIYIRFNYNSWVNSDLDRFTFLTEEQKNTILSNPSLVCLLFSQT
jgi:hypothetical protein